MRMNDSLDQMSRQNAYNRIHAILENENTLVMAAYAISNEILLFFILDQSF